MPITCIVVGCGSRSMRDKISFFNVPTVTNYFHLQDLNELTRIRREKWLRAIRRTNLRPSIIKYQKVCAKHFITGKPAAIRDVNHPDWVPTQNMGYISGVNKKRESDVARHERFVKRIKQETKEACPSLNLDEEHNYVITKQSIIQSQKSEEMTRKCFVPFCKSGYTNSEIKHVLFKAPRDEKRRKEWAVAIQRVDRDFTEKDVVCLEHFQETDIINSWDSSGIIISYKRPRLKGTAIPSKFFYLNENGTVKEPYRITGKILDKSCMEMINEIEQSDELVDKKYVEVNTNIKKSGKMLDDGVEKQSGRMINSNKSCVKMEDVKGKTSDKLLFKTCDEIQNKELKIMQRTLNKCQTDEEIPNKSLAEAGKEETEGMIQQTLFENIWNEKVKLNLPNRSWAAHFVEQDDDKYIVITEMTLDANKELKLVRKIIINACDSTIMTFINSKQIQLDLLKNRNSTIFPIRSVKALEIVLKSFNEISICLGGPAIMLNPHLDFSSEVAIVELCGLWRHIECTIVKREEEECCKKCAILFDAFHSVNHNESNIRCCRKFTA